MAASGEKSMPLTRSGPASAIACSFDFFDIVAT